ncbi:bifunctional [glutamate--ammonia ligase]-adenylyl-L-tyrosine phosphorylase/[glutamate--ammonia-ligase] adenylyltransferase [Cellvibrio sp. OA-2007]|uniref:bifunctional [glutamate--ammonia ligase]-adenylyl-L-tyrosine phosphorylase/[glutamate--ammonia-ligase] adenylyltransferase n=1 Tax=Cellvibrio sp. OA-2007 TaxID=529823 RepID=UPI0007806BA4|nr:bifunctional [glutamate--ammonia ligase]-adenylyl-L-tyrosine phosphorylase/[glutamate--ammonia-ligase] adenylyltransferase [Cellvibrio sp. OA-2007]
MLNFSAIPAELHAQAQRYWDQFEAAIQNQNLAHPRDLLPVSVTADEFSRQLTCAFVASEFIAKTVAQRPQYLLELMQSGELFDAQTDAHLDAFAAAVNACNSDMELDKCLRHQRQMAMIRIIWRDLNRIADMQVITAELSRFADKSILLAAEFHYRALEKMYGTPIGRESNSAQPFMVLGMGKLGAGELNVSSDIDLIFTYPESGETNHVSRAISNQEFFIKLGQKLIKSLDTVTADGFVFRVDMRLRPHGQSGALAMSFAGMEDYYQTQGREWERYAMIKARTVAMAGGEGQIAARKLLRKMLQPFTYRQYIDFSAIESLREMKGLIARQVQRKGMNLDVKLGEGGIREVEFVVQVFQLIRGGRDARLRKRKVPVLLPFLEQENYLPPGAGSALLEAYIFLRNTEHAIQGYQDKQTQSLPTDPVGQLRLAWVMGFDTWDSFFETLSRYRQCVNAEFKAVIAAPEEEDSIDQKVLNFWLGLWEGSLQGEDAINALEAFDIEGAAALLKNLADLRESRTILSMQASSRTRLEAFIPRLLQALVHEAQRGKLPLTIAETFARIVPLIEAIARRSAYLVLLVENPTAVQQLISLCAASPWIADQLTQYPALLDELLTPESLYTPPDKDLLRDELRRDVLRLNWDDLEGHMEALRYFRSAHALRVAASEVTGVLPLMKVSDYLTWIAEVVLEHVLQLSWEHLVERHGRPKRADGSVDTSPDFVIVGYGKLGGIELGHGSDLDLVFIHNADANLSSDGERSIDNITFYTRLGQRIIHVLNTYTPSGKLYEVDMRLRPSGNSGLLVTSLAAFEKYQANEAWTWEHQALVRARVVAGDARLAELFDAVRQRILSQARDLDQLRTDVSDMRRKMREQLGSEGKSKANALNSSKAPALFNLKQDAGGIVDIEFMVQYAALAWAAKAPEIIRYTDNIRILGSLEEAGLLDAQSVAHLIAAYKAYRSTGHRLALQRQEAVLEGDNHFLSERAQVTALWQQLIDHD